MTRICERKNAESGQIIWPDSCFSFFEFNIFEPFRFITNGKWEKRGRGVYCTSTASWMPVTTPVEAPESAAVIIWMVQFVLAGTLKYAVGDPLVVQEPPPV